MVGLLVVVTVRVHGLVAAHLERSGQDAGHPGRGLAVIHGSVTVSVDHVGEIRDGDGEPIVRGEFRQVVRTHIRIQELLGLAHQGLEVRRESTGGHLQRAPVQ